jgi:guanylate kinase
MSGSGSSAKKAGAARAKPEGAGAGFVEIRRRGLMLVLSSPSGAGKTSISRALLARDPLLQMSVSATTRPKRPGEVPGVDYLFVDATEFNLMVNRQEFLEYAKVFGNYYGTPRAPVEAALAAGRDVLFDIDWQGTQQLAERAPEDLVTVFILPPSTRELERRLRSRAQDSAEEVARRMAKAADELSHWPEYHYVLVNRDLEDTVRQVQAILQAERLRRERQVGLHEFVKALREGQ